ncbi:hypothetical protein MKX03_032074, partial [Papaver bracteatum]
TKIVFWDFRDAFTDSLYKPNVSRSRLELLIRPLAEVMKQLRNFIKDDSLWDHIVAALLQAILVQPYKFQ